MLRTVLIACLWFGLLGGSAWADMAAEQLLPQSTKGFIAIPDMQRMLGAFEHTGLGIMIKDESIRPFVQDLEKQLTERFGITGVRIGLSWEDVQSVCAKEACVAFVRPEDIVQKHSIVTIVNVAGKDAEVAKLLAKIGASMKERKATEKKDSWDGVPVSLYTVPTQRRNMLSFVVAVLVHDGKLIASDHPRVARDVLNRIRDVKRTDNLAAMEAFQTCLRRVAEQSDGISPHVVWYFEPLGYAELAQDAAGGRQRNRPDFLKVLRHQGFDAVKGIGGVVNFDAGKYEILQRAFAFAPAVAGSPTRFKLAARVMEFNSDEELTVEPWVPANVGTCADAAWGIESSYQHIGTLIDEVAGDEGFWDDLKDTIKNDPSGPRLDLDLMMSYFGTRVTAITDYQEPIGPTSERFLVAIDVKNPVKLKEALTRALKDDQDVSIIQVDPEHSIWEIKDEPAEENDFDLESVEGFDEGEDDEMGDAGPAGNPFLSNAALSVVRGKFVVSSHVAFVKEFIANSPPASLGQAEEFQSIQVALAEIGAGKGSVRIYANAEQEAHASYELLREGKMPESQGLIGKVLNVVLGPKEKGVAREQRIDGKNMPEYAKVGRYLGTLGMYMRAEKDGWFMAGISLKNRGLADTHAHSSAATEVVTESTDAPASDTNAAIDGSSTDANESLEAAVPTNSPPR